MNKLYILKGVTSADVIKKIANDYDIKNYKIIKNEYGKPYFENNNIYFNISNSGLVTVAAVSDKEIGIDIQRIKYNDAIVNRTFTESEKEYLNKSTDKAKAFTLIWTMKESYVKMLGVGIGYGLKNIDTINIIDKFKVIEYEEYIISIYEWIG